MKINYNGVNVLIIGSRFGRMIYELAKLGYKIEANERNYVFTLVVNYLFNYSKKMNIVYVQELAHFAVVIPKKM